MKVNDFIALETALWKSNVSDSDAPRDGQTIWQTAYIEAIEKAILMDDYSDLILLLNEKQPLHSMLLPALADAIAARGLKKSPGVKPRLTSTQQQTVARSVQYLRRTGISAEVAIEEIGGRFSISESTVKRAYLKYIPDHMRPALNHRGM